MVTYALIVANVLVFISGLSAVGDPEALSQIYFDYALIPAISDPLTYVSSQFIHGGFLHLAGNMLFLWIFGDNMEDELGHAAFLVFYLVGGIAAGLAQTLSDPGSTIPMIGASGAIAAVMGGYLLLFPKARVDVLIIFVVFFRIFPIPAWIVLAVWFGLQMFSGLSTPTTGGGVAYWAHAGGFLAGLAMTLPFWLKLGGPGFWQRTAGHPPHPDAHYRHSVSAIPVVPRRK